MPCINVSGVWQENWQKGTLQMSLHEIALWESLKMWRYL